MDYNSYYTNTTNHPEDQQKEYKDPNQLEPKKAAKGYLFILILIAVILGLWFLNEKLDKDEEKKANNSNSQVTSNVDSNQ